MPFFLKVGDIHYKWVLMKGMTLTAFAQKLGINVSDEKIITGFSIDSRLVRPGEVFFALKGEKVDGHDYLQEVASKKVLAAVVSQDYKGESFGLPLLYVKNVISSLQSLAKEELAQWQPKVIGVTGSVGKTTTKEFIATLLEGKFQVTKSLGNANTQVSLPLTILNADKSKEILVQEMGMSLPGEIASLVDIAPPDIAVITKIALAHSEFFQEGEPGIAKAKAEILSHPKTRIGVVNAQCLEFEPVANAGCKKVSFSLDAMRKEGMADFILHEKEGKWQIEERGNKGPVFSLPFKASHLAENFLAAAAVARELGMSMEEIISRAQLLATYKRRFERVERNGIVFINDSYNANPASMTAALTNLPACQKGKKRIAVLGEMKELGKFSKESHEKIGNLALQCVDELLCYGSECLPMVQAFNEGGRAGEYFTDFNEMKSRVFALAEAGDVVLIKGSNSKKMWRILEEDDSH